MVVSTHEPAPEDVFKVEEEKTAASPSELLSKSARPFPGQPALRSADAVKSVVLFLRVSEERPHQAFLCLLITGDTKTTRTF